MRRLYTATVLSVVLVLPSTPAPADVLWDNGPLVTTPGGGYGGADVSERQTLLDEHIIGVNHDPGSLTRLADDFMVTYPGGWTIDTITFYAYQTGSSTTSTIEQVYLRIWDGHPRLASSNVVFGDTTTNRLISTTWSGIYRADDVAPLDHQRPIMENDVDVGVTLGPGTYWLDWQSDGSLSGGPYAPPVSLPGQTHPEGANAWQGISTSWYGVIDGGSGTWDDLPFLINGSPEPTTVSMLALCGLILVRRRP